MQNDWQRKRSGPQFLKADGSFGNERPQYLRPQMPSPPIPKPQGIHLSEAAAKKIAEAISIFLREPPKPSHRRR